MYYYGRRIFAAVGADAVPRCHLGDLSMIEDDQTRVGQAEPVILYALPVGDGIIALSPIPGAGGAYQGDLEHMSSWRPAMVMSLVTNVELVEVGAQSLGQHIQDKGTRWVQLPMRVGEVPNANSEEMWPAISAQARKALFGGGRVMIHSLEGRGRSGMLALRLMIEAGEAPDEALSRLAAVQRGSFLNEAQRAWAMQAEREPVPFVRHARTG